MTIRIRKEKLGDAQQIRMVTELAFGQPQEADIVEGLRRTCSNLLSIVAIMDDEIVGHILFSPVTLETKSRQLNGMGLAPMAVSPEYQRQGIGSQMIKQGLFELEKSGCPFIIVLGHPEYYPRFGFNPASRYNIQSEWDVPDDVFMITVFDKQQLKGVTGIARYHPEFAKAM